MNANSPQAALIRLLAAQAVREHLTGKADKNQSVDRQRQNRGIPKRVSNG